MPPTEKSFHRKICSISTSAKKNCYKTLVDWQFLPASTTHLPMSDGNTNNEPEQPGKNRKQDQQHQQQEPQQEPVLCKLIEDIITAVKNNLPIKFQAKSININW